MATNSRMIYSIDPEAIEKLREKLHWLEFWQAKMKATNKYWREYGTCEGLDDMSFELAQKFDGMVEPDANGPFSPRVLSNNSAEIRRIRERIEILDSRQSEADKQINGQLSLRSPSHRKTIGRDR